MKKEESNNITTPPVRVSYPSVLKLDKFGKHSIMLMFDKSNKEQMACLKKVKAMCEKVRDAQWPDENKRPRIPMVGHDKSPIKDGDKNCDGNGVPLAEKSPEYKGHYVLRASTGNVIYVVNRARQEIVKGAEIYGGCFCKVNINPYTFNHDLNKGVTFGLNGVQKWEDGEPFGKSRPKLDDMFDADEEFMDEDDGGFEEEEEDILGGKGNTRGNSTLDDALSNNLDMYDDDISS